MTKEVIPSNGHHHKDEQEQDEDQTHHFLHQGDQLMQPPPQLSHFLPDLCGVLLIHLLQRLEGVARVCAAPQSTLVTDALATGPAVHTQLLLVTFTPEGWGEEEEEGKE